MAASTLPASGPEPSEGKPAGTVFVSVVRTQDTLSRELHFDGHPEEVLRQTCQAALMLLAEEFAD